MNRNKKLKITYWIVLLLFSFGMLSSSIPGILKSPSAIEYFCNVLKLPEYLLVFISVAKIIGLIPLYIPGYPRLKEWVYAGFAYDLIGAWYCSYRALNSLTATAPLLIFILFLFVLYYLHHRIQSSQKQNAAQ